MIILRFFVFVVMSIGFSLSTGDAEDPAREDGEEQQQQHPSTPVTPSEPDIHTTASWVSYRGKSYLFVMDIGRRQDLSHSDAKRRCSDFVSGLVTVDTEEEFEFLKREIQNRVVLSGQEFAHEQWWTAGMVSKNSWVWDTDNKPQVTVSALKRKHVPKKGVQFLALSHGHDQQGWRLRSVPGNYKLRYICQKLQPGAYSKEIEPATPELIVGIEDSMSRDQAAASSVTLKMKVISFVSLDEERQVLCSKNAFTMTWNYTRLPWNKLGFENSTVLQLPATKVWTPHVTIMNGVGKHHLEEIGNSQVSVVSTGFAKVKFVEDVCSTCDGDAFLFPFDRYHCPIWFSSPSIFNLKQRAFDIEPLDKEWNSRTALWIVDGGRKLGRHHSTQQQQQQHPPPHPSYNASQCIQYKVHFKRHLVFYSTVLLIPMALLTVPLIVLLLISPGHRIKIPAILAMVVVFGLQIQFVCLLVPRSISTFAPLLVLYPLTLMIVSVASVCISLVFTRYSPSYGSVSSGSSFKTGCCCCCSIFQVSSSKKKRSANFLSSRVRCSCESIDSNAVAAADDLLYQKALDRIGGGNGSASGGTPTAASVSRKIAQLSKVQQPLCDSIPSTEFRSDEDRNSEVGSMLRKHASRLNLDRTGSTDLGAVAARSFGDDSASCSLPIGGEKRTSRRRSGCSERKIDMAMFIFVTLMLNAYIVSIILLSF